MKIRYDAEADAMYIKLLNDEVDHTKEVEEDGDIILDYNKKGKVVGVEILFVKEKNMLESFKLENLTPA